MTDEAWNRKPRRIGKVVFEEDKDGNTNFDVFDNYGYKVGSGTGFPIERAMVEVIQIAYELRVGEMEHLYGICSRHTMVQSKEFNLRHGMLQIKKKGDK